MSRARHSLPSQCFTLAFLSDVVMTLSYFGAWGSRETSRAAAGVLARHAWNERSCRDRGFGRRRPFAFCLLFVAALNSAPFLLLDRRIHRFFLPFLRHTSFRSLLGVLEHCTRPGALSGVPHISTNKEVHHVHKCTCARTPSRTDRTGLVGLERLLGVSNRGLDKFAATSVSPSFFLLVFVSLYDLVPLPPKHSSSPHRSLSVS